MPVPCPKCKTEIPASVPTIGDMTYECPSCAHKLTSDQLRALRVKVDDSYEPDAPPLTTNGYTAISMPAPWAGPLGNKARSVQYDVGTQTDEGWDAAVEEATAPKPVAKKATRKRAVKK